MQFASMVERGVSLARAVFAFNSVNAEGWGLYAEAITLPYMPDDGKLISLQLRLQRAARAFLDPELQTGKWTPHTAREFLQKEVGLSAAFATQEVDRYTFRAPAQATAYYYGYLRILELRDAAQKQLGARFEPMVLRQVVVQFADEVVNVRVPVLGTERTSAKVERRLPGKCGERGVETAIPKEFILDERSAYVEAEIG